LERLERATGKLARRVLRGGGDSNAASLPNRTSINSGPAILGSVFSFVLAPLFLLHSKQELFHSPNRCVFSLKERDDHKQNVQQLLDQ
jgi:hypothetical protein